MTLLYLLTLAVLKAARALCGARARRLEARASRLGERHAKLRAESLLLAKAGPEGMVSLLDVAPQLREGQRKLDRAESKAIRAIDAHAAAEKITGAFAGLSRSALAAFLAGVATGVEVALALGHREEVAAAVAAAAEALRGLAV